MGGLEAAVTDRIRHPELARRFEIAMRGHPHVPPHNYGRLGWFVRQFDERFGVSITEETVRKWLSGEARPRHKRLSALAEILSVDEAWLSVGSQRVDRKQTRMRNAQASGAVNLVAGMIQMDGGTPAFPDEVAPEIDIYAIIKGAHYSLHVATGVPTKGGGWTVNVAPGALDEGILILALLPLGGFCYRVIELAADEVEVVAQRSRDGLEVEVSVDLTTGDVEWGQVTSFAERL